MVARTFTLLTKITLISLVGALFLTACAQSEDKGTTDADTNLLLGLMVGTEQGRSAEAGKDFVLNGRWNSFTGNETTSNTITTIHAKQGSDGLKLDDSSGWGGFSNCGIIKHFDNGAGFFIVQNPENNGGCFSNDSNKGKFFKIVFFANQNRENSYWQCTINFPGVDTLAAAIALNDTTTKTNPGTSGCGNSAWSRIERR